MPRAVINNAAVLKFLLQAKPKYRRALLQAADKDLVHCVCECVHNTLKGKVPLKPNQKSKLCKYKKLLRKIIKPGENYKQKKKLLIQKGGAFLPLLLASLISGVLSGLFK